MESQKYAFISCDSEYDECEAVIFGVPFDGTTSFRPGARFGPTAVRTESFGIETYSPYVDEDLVNCKIFDAGDIEIPISQADIMVDNVRGFVAEIVADEKIPIMLGGEHLVTLGAVQAVANKYPDVTVIHFDAHADLREDYLGERFSHACVMRRIFEENLMISSFGIRSGEKTEFDFAKEYTHLQKFNFNGLEDLCIDVLKSTPVYLTIDLDVLDPAEFPGTGTPEAGGVTFNELNKAIQIIAKNTDIVGADLVELAPNIDPSGRSTALACKILRELLLNICNCY